MAQVVAVLIVLGSYFGAEYVRVGRNRRRSRLAMAEEPPVVGSDESEPEGAASADARTLAGV